ncbi:Stf0 family sulfotransferase [Dapis sp. BLCC M126]|uniref:Stf0 family sulfotransferase n=1 Tax=Dapis sp. BLCC M126 TaxID=3400189 RepID=UPI003CF6C785
MEKKSYIVCSTPRSGSTLLCKTLEELGGCGQPEEYFHRHTIKKLKLNNNPDQFLSYCHSICQEGLRTHGVFGMKMHWWQLLDFLSIARQSPSFENKRDWDIINALFPNPKFIYLCRRDIIAQAVSATIAMQTGQWEKIRENQPKNPLQSVKKSQGDRVKSIKFQPWKIYEWEKNIKDNNLCWRFFFNDNCLNYYEIVYEDMVKSLVNEITNVVDYIGIDKSKMNYEIQAHTQRQFNIINQKFINYYKLCPNPLLKLLYGLYVKRQNS